MAEEKKPTEADIVFDKGISIDKMLKGGLVFDEMVKKFADKSEGGGLGYVNINKPKEMKILLDYTVLRGGGSNIYYSIIYQLPKWDFKVVKVDEYIHVTPTWAEYYNITIAQKQKLEQAIKAGLASAMQAVTDYELLKHDLRRYQEILDYFKQAKTDEHVLRSLFVDRVDIHTGEGYSLVTMARRWPTIITDFIRMKDSLSDRDAIRKELDVSMAEATILKTKNDLFNEWKKLFFPAVKERYARIKALVDSRRQSIDEYRNWLKPYVAMYRQIREKAESNPAVYIHDAYFTPSFGQAQALTGVRLMAFKGYVPEEKGKPEIMSTHKKGWWIYPYDKFTAEWHKKIEEHYGVEVKMEDIEKWMENNMQKNRIYYMLFDMPFVLSLVRTPPPEGFETDNMMIVPQLETIRLSQNALLVLGIELLAREELLKKYVNQMIGATEIEKDIYNKVEEEFMSEEERKKKEREKKKEEAIKSLKEVGSKIFNGLDRFAHIFIKRGPYESSVKERVSKMHHPVIGDNYKMIVDFIEKKMGVD